MRSDEWCADFLNPVAVGCFPIGTGCTEDGVCFRRPKDGAIFVGSSSCLAAEGWTLCSEEENSSITECGAGGAAGEGGA